MFKKFSEISGQLIAISLIVVVGVHSLNSFFNTHSHQLEDGTIITHAHPYERSSDSSPFETHHHTATELVFLASLMHFLPAIAFAMLGCLLINWKETKHFYQILKNQLSSGIPNQRGPPSLLFSL